MRIPSTSKSSRPFVNSNRAGGDLATATDNENEDDESCAYESIAATAAANDEFERYIRLDTATTVVNFNAATSQANSNTNSKPIHLTPFIDAETVGPSGRSGAQKAPNMYQLHKQSTLTDSMMMSDTESGTKKSQEAVFSSSSSFRPPMATSTNDDDLLYGRVLEKLARSSLDSPAIVPLLCVRSFGPNDMQWNQLLTRFVLNFLRRI